jgi:hypothetical protein
MITIKTTEEIDHMRTGGKMLATILGELAAMVAPGRTTAELEEYAQARTKELGALPAFQGYDAGGIAPPFPTAHSGQRVAGIPAMAHPPATQFRGAAPSNLSGSAAPAISRNALCPCGSGKKYKHCHGQLS